MTTQDEIIEMAREAGAGMLHGGEFAIFGNEKLITFAKLVAAKQREDSAKICDEFCYNTTEVLVYQLNSQRTWVGLTDEEIDSYFEDHGWSPSEYYYPVIKDIEAKLKKKNEPTPIKT
jgi:hypothetical protein